MFAHSLMKIHKYDSISKMIVKNKIENIWIYRDLWNITIFCYYYNSKKIFKDEKYWTNNFFPDSLIMTVYLYYIFYNYQLFLKNILKNYKTNYGCCLQIKITVVLFLHENYFSCIWSKFIWYNFQEINNNFTTNSWQH